MTKGEKEFCVMYTSEGDAITTFKDLASFMQFSPKLPALSNQHSLRLNEESTTLLRQHTDYPSSTKRSHASYMTTQSEKQQSNTPKILYLSTDEDNFKGLAMEQATPMEIQ